MDLACLSVNVDIENYESAVWEILSVIRPSWQAKHIEIEKLSKGYFNGLLKCSIPEQDAIIVRVFGDVPICHRESEVAIVKLASDKGIFPQLYCRFDNGISYAYTRGNVATRQDLNNEKFLRLLANLLHKIHLLEAKPLLEKAPRPTVDRILPLLWQNIMNSDYTDVLKDPRYMAYVPPFEELEKLWNQMLEVYKQLCEFYPLVCCHSDPHIHNIVHNIDKEQVTLLDWEACQLAPEIIDLAIVIDRDTEFSEVFHCLESRKKWLQIYLSTHPTYGKKPITDALFQQWYRDSLKASMVNSIAVVVLFIDFIKNDTIEPDALGRYKQYEKELESLEQEKDYVSKNKTAVN